MTELRTLVLVATLAWAALCQGRQGQAEAATLDTRLADEDSQRYALPEGMLWGGAVSAVQSEGAWNEDGKVESAVDKIVHTLGNAVFPKFHDTAADSYHKFKDDVEMAAKLKHTVYKFSMSWARILPTSDPSKPNPKGVKFYHDLIKAIRDNNMTPMVMMYHFDHPQALEDEFKGWQDRKMVAKFAEYAKFLFDEYGQEVDLWASINEPNMYCAYFTTMMVMAGLRTQDEVPVYECLHYNILAHKEAYRIFKAGNYPGKLGFTGLLMHGAPATTKPEDVYAADAFNQVHAGILLHPVVYGDYPQIVKNLAGDKLPKFTEQEKTDLKGSSDFFGLNIYFGMNVAYNWNPDPTASSGGGGGIQSALGSLMQDLTFTDVTMAGTNGNPAAAFTTIYPDVMRDGLLWTHQNFKIPIAICENGFGDVLGLGMHDNQRAAYHSAFLRALVDTVHTKGVDVIAYTAWSLIDSFEFTAGYGRPFGMVHVDYEGGTLTRSLKDSSKFWIEMAESKVVPYVAPDSTSTAAPTTAPPTTAAPATAPTTPGSSGMAAQASLGLLLASFVLLML